MDLLSWLLYLSASAIVLLCTIFAYFQYVFQYWKNLGVPYIEPEFFYGNLKEPFFNKKMVAECVEEWYKSMKAKRYKHMGIYFFKNPIYIPIDPVLVKNILAIDFKHFHDRGFYHSEENDPINTHLFTITGIKWKYLRSKLTSSFTSGKLKTMFQTLVDCSDDLSSCLNEYVRKDEPVDIKKVVVRYTTNVIGSCAFGIECNSFKDPNTDFIRLGKRVFQPNFIDNMKMLFSLIFPSAAHFFKLRLTNKEVDTFFRTLVKDTIEYREKNNIYRNDFMDLLLQLKNKGTIDEENITEEKIETTKNGITLTVNEIAAQTFLFFIAGFDTSSISMTFSLFELAKHQHIQDKVREEIVTVLKQHDGKITYDALMQMTYFERAIQETLRKWPIVGNLQRLCTKDYKVPNTDITIKKGVVVYVPALAFHHDPEFYPNPEKFDPDRFTEENGFTRPDYTYLPFGEGPRQCIGKRFALLQVKVGLCRMLINYKFTVNNKTVEPIEMDPKCVMPTAKDGIWLNVQKVNS